METNEPEVTVEPDVEEEEDISEPEPTETTDWEARAKKLEEKAIVQRERTRTLKERIAKLERAQKEVPQKAEKNTGELDETQLDYLDLKGISEDEDIAVIQRHVQRTGETVRQALKDEYVQSKLEANKAKREVKDATPSATKRGGNQTNDIGMAIARYEATGELPADFALRSAVVNALESKSNRNKPAWHS